MRKAIIIDDSKAMAQLVSGLLSEFKYQPIISFTIEDALKVPVTPDVAVIVTDIFMPGMGGIEGIGLLRKRFPMARIVAMTAGWDEMESDDVLTAALKIGADSGLKKPITPQALLQAVEAA